MTITMPVSAHAPGSTHARPYAQPPINMDGNYLIPLQYTSWNFPPIYLCPLSERSNYFSHVLYTNCVKSISLFVCSNNTYSDTFLLSVEILC